MQDNQEGEEAYLRARGVAHLESAEKTKMPETEQHARMQSGSGQFRRGPCQSSEGAAAAHGQSQLSSTKMRR